MSSGQGLDRANLSLRLLTPPTEAQLTSVRDFQKNKSILVHEQAKIYFGAKLGYFFSAHQ
jgi:hypothetical protein